MSFIKKQTTTTDTQQPSLRTTSIDVLDRELQKTNRAELPNSMSLTAQELYMLKQAGYEPVQIVVGSIVYSMGVRGLLSTIGKALTRGEMPDFTRMNQDARELALIRMCEKARELGCTDVMDVTLHETSWSDFLEVVAQGTACKRVSDLKEMPIVAGN